MKTFVTAERVDSARGCFLTLVVMLAMAGCESRDPGAPTRPANGGWHREEWAGHVYVVREGEGYGSGSGIAHDPDCPCTKRLPAPTGEFPKE